MESKRTRYQFHCWDPAVPRCRNTHTLAPLFLLRDSDNNIVTEPVLLSNVPSKFLWVNSDGYGFDIRNLSKLLRVNFRNVNPHTIIVQRNIVVSRPLWTSREDLASLLNHPELSPSVGHVVAHRVQLLNLLSDSTKRMLARTAGELYSASYQGFYDWVAAMPDFDQLVQAMGYRLTQSSVLRNVEEIQEQKRKDAVAAMRSTLGTQCAEHFCEPAGVKCGSDLYHLLEHYKAEVTQDAVKRVEDLADRRSVACFSAEDQLDKHRAQRMTNITRRCTAAVHRAMFDPRRRGLALRLRKARSIPLWSARFAASMSAFNLSDNEESREPLTVTVALTQEDQYEVAVGDVSFPVEGVDDVLALVDDAVAALLEGHRRVEYASVTGGVAALLPKNKQCQETLRSDNRFLKAVATVWAYDMPFTSKLRQVLTKEDGPLWADLPCVRVRELRARMDKGVLYGVHLHVLRQFAINAPAIFEYDILTRQRWSAGYDNFSGSLLEKFRATLQCRTCAQDLGGDMCELLSVPFAPEDAAAHAQFQCDHTNVQRSIVVRPPKTMVPVTQVRLPEHVWPPSVKRQRAGLSSARFGDIDTFSFV